MTGSAETTWNLGCCKDHLQRFVRGMACLAIIFLHLCSVRFMTRHTFGHETMLVVAIGADELAVIALVLNQINTL